MELQDLNKPQQPRERFNWTHTRRAVNDDGPGRGSLAGTAGPSASALCTSVPMVGRNRQRTLTECPLRLL
jgi:hypothetical protein